MDCNLQCAANISSVVRQSQSRFPYTTLSDGKARSRMWSCPARRLVGPDSPASISYPLLTARCTAVIRQNFLVLYE